MILSESNVLTHSCHQPVVSVSHTNSSLCLRLLPLLVSSVRSRYPSQLSLHPQVLVSKFCLSFPYSSILTSCQYLYLSNLSSHNALSRKPSLLPKACGSPHALSSAIPNPSLSLPPVAPNKISLPSQSLLFFCIFLTIPFVPSLLLP